VFEHVSRRQLVVRVATTAVTFALAFAASAQTLSDPTAPPQALPGRAQAENNAPAWRLQSTLVGANRRIAVINGRAVVEGEAVDGAVVERIQLGRVRLRVGEAALELPMSIAVHKDASTPRGRP